MLTDMGPSAGQFYGSQIPSMGMNITNITSHIQKPNVSAVSLELHLCYIIVYIGLIIIHPHRLKKMYRFNL